MRQSLQHYSPWNEAASSCARWLAMFVCATLLLMPIVLHAQDKKPTDFNTKAAYLLNFGKFVRWPKPFRSVHDTFCICVLGNDPFGAALNATIAGGRVGGKKVTVRRIRLASEAEHCRIVFLSSSENPRLSSELSTLSKLPVLTVSDMEGFADRHGMIQFVTEQDRVRFVVNLTAAERAGLSLSSELLKVAAAVKREGEPGE